MVAAMPIQVAIIGCGKLGRVHALSYRSAGARVAVVADTNAASAQALATELGCDWSLDPGQVLADPAIAGVSICVPTHLHQALLQAAMRQHKPALVEKPLTARLDQARELLQGDPAARARGSKLAS